MKEAKLNMFQLKQLLMFRKKEKSLIIMPLNIKPNIFLKSIKRDTLNTSHKRELLKELNITQLKDKSFINLKFKSQFNKYQFKFNNYQFNTFINNQFNTFNTYQFNT